jgi:hypothetical protein
MATNPAAACPPYHQVPSYCDIFYYAKGMISLCDNQLSAPMVNQRKEDNEKYRKATEAEAAPADTAVRVVLHWGRCDKTDPLSGKVTPEACDTEKDDATGETIRATATCDDSMTFGVALEQIISGTHEAPVEDIQFAAVGNNETTLLWNSNSISIRYRIGVEAVNTISAKQGDYRNAVTLRFSYSDMSLARNFGVELPLANGNTPVVEINPKDPILRAFTEICEKQAGHKDKL